MFLPEETQIKPLKRNQILSLMASLACGAKEMRAAEGYLLELLAWCAFADRSLLGGTNAEA